ncbi:hypothetical protein JCM3774_000050 [Rhodotorula dairenensis]
MPNSKHRRHHFGLEPLLCPERASSQARAVPTEPQSRLRTLGVDPASWMAALPDHVRLDTLYLPGTHQSLALNYPLASSLCQTTTLTAQLRGGIRCLDLRFALIRDDKHGGKPTLWAYHGVVPQGREMSQVLREVYAWLESPEGRRETVVISIKQENAGHEFAARVWELIDSTRPYMWYDRDVWPTLGQVRGRCVMFCRFGFDSGRGLHPPIWPNDKPYPWRTEVGGRETIVQDWYGVRSPLSIPDKARLVLSLFDSSSAVFAAPHKPVIPSSHAGAGTTPSSPDAEEAADSTVAVVPFRINFLSCGTFPTLYPSHAAKGFGAPSLGIGYRGVNQLVCVGLDRLDRSRRSGEQLGSAETEAGVLLLPRTRQEAQPGQVSREEEDEEEEEKRSILARAPASSRLPSGAERAAVASGGGRRRREGQGGMLVLMDFWESPRGRDSLVDRIVEMNF